MICHNCERTPTSVFFVVFFCSQWKPRLRHLVANHCYDSQISNSAAQYSAAQLFSFCFFLLRSASQTHLMRNNGQTTESALIRWGCQIRGAPPPRRRGEILLCSNGEKQLSRRANSITACLSDVPAAARSQRDRYEFFLFIYLFWFCFLLPLSDGNTGCVTHPQLLETCLYPPTPHPSPSLFL